MSNAAIPVIILKITCPLAVRFAFAVAPIAANMAVSVVPIFAPITDAAASWSGMLVVLAIVSITAIDALDDCIIIVSTNHPSRNQMSEYIQFPLIPAKSKIVPMCEKPVCKNQIPRNSNPNHDKISPIFQNRFFSHKILMRTHNPITGNANSSIFNFNQINATSHPVMVVPTLVPNITHKELRKVIIPALTNHIVKSVVAVDDCRMAVARNPDKNHLNLVLVHFSSMRASVGPDAALSHSDISIMPNKNNPIHPANTE